jgi:hypothetical protein
MPLRARRGVIPRCTFVDRVEEKRRSRAGVPGKRSPEAELRTPPMGRFHERCGPHAGRGHKMADAKIKERVRRRAYLLWEQEGRPEGHAEYHWRRAEAEVTGINRRDEARERVCPECEGTGRIGRKRYRACGGTGRIVDAPEP